MNEFTAILIFLLGFWLGSKSCVDLEEIIKSPLSKKIKTISNKLRTRNFEVFDNDEYAIEQEEMEREKKEKERKEKEIFNE